jgi:hypothetical protein
VPDILEVYPPSDHHLLEDCQHRFCHVEKAKRTAALPANEPG